jgi:hypothetical protein
VSAKLIITCNECGAQKGETNGWLSVYEEDNRKNICLSHTYSNAADGFDACGRECAQKVLERWLDTGSILKQEGEQR